MTRKPRRPITDDEVLQWWAAWEELGWTLGQIAAHFNRNPNQIAKRFADLGIRPIRPRPPSQSKKLTEDQERMRHYELLSANERLIADALSRVAGMLVEDIGGAPCSTLGDAFGNRKHLPYAMSLQHVIPTRGRHRRTVMSARQRRQDRMSSAVWRAAVRKDLRAAGLL